jgi:hypothetical protein
VSGRETDQSAQLPVESSGLPAHMGPGPVVLPEPTTDQAQPTWPTADESDTAPQLAPIIKASAGSDLA